MKKILTVLFTIISVQMVNGQCPPGASAIHSIWLFTHEFPEPIHTDTICEIFVSHFPASSKVYVNNNSSVLIDSLVTDAAGYGHLNLTPGQCLTYGAGSIVGTAVSGSCTTNISSVGLLPIHLKTFAVTTSDNKVKIQWQLEEETPGIVYNLQESSNGTDFITIYTVSNTISSTPGQQYQYSLPQPITAKRFYRLKITEYGGAIHYSPIKTVWAKGYHAMDVYPTIGNGQLSITITENFINGELKIFNIAGMVVQSQKIKTPAFNTFLNISKGIFYVKAIAPDGTTLVKTIFVQ